jgi:hypothetical protein
MAFLLGLMLCRGIILSLRNLSRIASRRGLGRICPLFIIRLLSILTHVTRTMELIVLSFIMKLQSIFALVLLPVCL